MCGWLVDDAVICNYVGDSQPSPEPRLATSSRTAVAVHVCTLLAAKADGPLTSDFIAGSVNTNPVVVRRLVGQLARAGLVRTELGAKGGVVLARPADRISLADILRAVEPGPLLALHASRPNPRCPVGRTIQDTLAPHFARGERALATALDAVTVADVMAECRAGAAH